MGKLKFPLVTDHLLIRPTDEKRIWTEEWTISLKDRPEEPIGTLTFAGERVAGEMPIRVELKPEYRDQDYGSEVFYFMSRFVFRFRDLREITAVCEHENDLCVHALDKAGYVFREHNDGRDYYSMKKSKTAWTGLYVFIGFIAGLAMGVVFSNLWVGLLTGVIAGTIFGYVLDKAWGVTASDFS
ncbi:MAG: GNAT family N-acetyltransferase [Lachnospiraceae bacterium]|jgi:hypothetical protein|nr:GNAT family N-acetyltransferase [Lachnospiraceae bacterium]